MMTPHFAETGLNRGAGSQEQPVCDVQVSGLVQEQSEGHVDDDNRYLKNVDNCYSVS